MFKIFNILKNSKKKKTPHNDWQEYTDFLEEMQALG